MLCVTIGDFYVQPDSLSKLYYSCPNFIISVQTLLTNSKSIKKGFFLIPP